MNCGELTTNDEDILQGDTVCYGVMEGEDFSFGLKDGNMMSLTDPNAGKVSKHRQQCIDIIFPKHSICTHRTIKLFLNRIAIELMHF